MSETADLYCDGGVAKVNPSPIGGSWCWVEVGADGVRRARAQGGITPAAAGVAAVSNNLTELLAAVEGLEAMPDGWAGTLHTDSNCTRFRVMKTRKQAKLSGIPEWLRLRLAAAKARLGPYSVRLLGGHPTKADLIRGSRKDGLPVSPHNVFCDFRCREESAKLLQTQGKAVEL